MKIHNLIRSFFAVSLVLLISACEKNEEVPDHSVVGEAYATEVDFTVSNTEPSTGETVEIMLSYVNYSQDPAVSVTFLESVNGGDRTTISTLDESGASTEVEITRTFNYTVPDAEDVTIYVELRSSKDYPQIEKVDMEVQ